MTSAGNKRGWSAALGLPFEGVSLVRGCDDIIEGLAFEKNRGWGAEVERSGNCDRDASESPLFALADPILGGGAGVQHLRGNANF